MKSRKGGAPVFLPWMMTDLMMSSWETIARRTMMMANDQCSVQEYHRMVSEKALAAVESGMKLMMGGGRASLESLMSPWLRRSRANAKRLRKI